MTRAFNWGSRRSRGTMAGYSPTMEADRRVHKGSHHQIDAIGRTMDRSKPPAKMKVRLRPGLPYVFFHTIPAPPLFAPAVSAAHLRPPPRPPTECPQKIVYWLWILAIFYLEQKIVIKQGVLLQPYEDRVIGNEFLWKTKILHVVLHVIIDGMTLFNLNALVPQWGVKYPNGPRRAPVLRMSRRRRWPSTRAQARAAHPQTQRRHPRREGWLPPRLHADTGRDHVLIPDHLRGAARGRVPARWLTCVGVTNAVFMVCTALQLPTAYGYDDDLRRMFLSTEENSAGKLLRIGAPAVLAAPFIVNVIVRNEFVSNYASAYLRLNQRILLGSNRTTKDAGVSLSRLQRSVVFAVGIASIANVNAVHSVFFSSVTRAGLSVETVAAAVMQFLLPCYLTMRHLSSAGKRGQGGFLRAAVYIRATLTMSFAALSAVFLDVCKNAAGTTSNLGVWRVAAPVALCRRAPTSRCGSRRGSSVRRGGRRFRRRQGRVPVSRARGAPEPDQNTQMYALAAMYIAALHLFGVTSFLFEDGRLLAHGSGGEAGDAGASLRGVGSSRLLQSSAGPLEDGGLRDRPGEVQARLQEVGAWLRGARVTTLDLCGTLRAPRRRVVTCRRSRRTGGWRRGIRAHADVPRAGLRQGCRHEQQRDRGSEAVQRPPHVPDALLDHRLAEHVLPVLPLRALAPAV